MDKSPEFVSPKEFKISISGSTEAGFDHPDVNEDTIAYDSKGGWAVLLDGVGGLDAGDRASQTAKDVIVRRISGIRDNMDPGKAQQEIAKSFMEASEQVRKKVPGRSGTTAVAVKVVGKERKTAVIASVGDSRVYLYRDGNLEQLTSDDSSLPPTLLRKFDDVNDGSELNEPEVRYFRDFRRPITQNLGQQEPLNVHTYQVELMEDDDLVLTSDGVHDNLTRGEIAQSVSEGGASQLVYSAFTRAKSNHFRAKMDDISAVVIEVGGKASFESQVESWSIGDAKDFNELYQSINTLGEVQGSRGSYSAAELLSLIDLVREHKLDVNLITRSEGIREKVVELLEKEKK